MKTITYMTFLLILSAPTFSDIGMASELVNLISHSIEEGERSEIYRTQVSLDTNKCTMEVREYSLNGCATGEAFLVGESHLDLSEFGGVRQIGEGYEGDITIFLDWRSKYRMRYKNFSRNQFELILKLLDGKKLEQLNARQIAQINEVNAKIVAHNFPPLHSSSTDYYCNGGTWTDLPRNAFIIKKEAKHSVMEAFTKVLAMCKKNM